MNRYDLRHSAATLLAAAGVPLDQIADVLGHESLRMSRQVYVHAQARPIDAAAHAMQATLGNGLAPRSHIGSPIGSPRPTRSQDERPNPQASVVGDEVSEFRR